MSQQDEKPPLLAWWGIFPGLAFAAVELYFGWPLAMAESHSFSFAVGNIVGRLMAGVLISLLIAWLAYRFGSRSQTTATCTFAVMLGLFCVSAINESMRAHSRNQDGESISSAPVATSFGDFQFDIPAGWQRVRPVKKENKATINLRGADASSPNGIIEVDFATPAITTARQMAQVLAGSDGQVLPNPVSVNGVEAVRVETPSKDMSRPRFAVVVLRGKDVYLIMAAGAHGTDVTAPFDQVLKSWHWNESP